MAAKRGRGRPKGSKNKVKKTTGTGKRGRPAGFKHSAKTKKKISTALKEVWKTCKRKRDGKRALFKPCRKGGKRYSSYRRK